MTKRMGGNVYDDWVQISAGLPRDGEQIEFVLDGRTVPMHGTYTLPAFHSHWATYGVDRVRRWRKLSDACDLATTPAGNQPVHVLSGAAIRAVGEHPLLAVVIGHAP